MKQMRYAENEGKGQENLERHRTSVHQFGMPSRTWWSFRHILASSDPFSVGSFALCVLRLLPAQAMLRLVLEHFDQMIIRLDQKCGPLSAQLTSGPHLCNLEESDT